jgi:hypothetical protein
MWMLRVKAAADQAARTMLGVNGLRGANRLRAATSTPAIGARGKAIRIGRQRGGGLSACLRRAPSMQTMVTAQVKAIWMAFGVCGLRGRGRANSLKEATRVLTTRAAQVQAIRTMLGVNGLRDRDRSACLSI